MNPVTHTHILSVDLEEWFQVSSFREILPQESWDTLEKRVPGQCRILLDLFRDCGATATFFIVGWVAARFPDLIREIADAGHEIASHSDGHRVLPELGPDGFREDLRCSAATLSEASGKAVVGYRAPAWSLNRDAMWAVDILREEGFRYDSSIYPIRVRYGQPAAARFPYRFDNGLWEFPLSTLRAAGQNIPVGGGAFFRVQPRWMTEWTIRQYQKAGAPFILYLHPWEIDPDHPRVKAGLTKWLIHYAGLSSTLPKLRKTAARHRFTSFERYLDMRETCGGDGNG